MYSLCKSFRGVLLINFLPRSPSGCVNLSSMTETFTEQQLLGMVKDFIPRMTSSMHKGQCGRIGVVGGCQEYTGAPYFAAISALKLGADLSHVFCTQAAAPVIKSYSPELIVHPVLDKASGVSEIAEWLPRMHSLVVGPGLGRDPNLFENIKGVIKKATELKIPLVVDADGVYFVTSEPDIIKGNTGAILTPNLIEYSRLFEKVFGEKLTKDKLGQSVPNLANALQGVTVVCKGAQDIISNGQVTVNCSNEGSVRRCGGQGDLLSGSMGTFTYWAHLHANAAKVDKSLVQNLSPTVVGAYAACYLTRECSRAAFTQHRRSMTTTDMIACIGQVFQQHFEHEDCKL